MTIPNVNENGGNTRNVVLEVDESTPTIKSGNQVVDATEKDGVIIDSPQVKAPVSQPSGPSVLTGSNNSGVTKLPRELVRLGFKLNYENEVPYLSLPLVGYSYYSAELDSGMTSPRPIFTSIKHKIRGDDVEVIVKTSQGEELTIKFNKKNCKGTIRNRVDDNRDGSYDAVETKSIQYTPYWTYAVQDHFDNEYNSGSDMSVSRNYNKFTVRGKADGSSFKESFVVTDNPVEGTELVGIKVLAEKTLEIRYRVAASSRDRETDVRTDPDTGEVYRPLVVHARANRIVDGKVKWDVSFLRDLPGAGVVRRVGMHYPPRGAQQLIDAIIKPANE